MNILLCINRKCIFPTKILISSLEDTQNENLNIFIAHKELTKTDIESIEFAIDKTKTTISYIKINTSMFEGFPVSERFPIEVYFRLYVSEFLPKEIDRILYLDADTLVINSVKDLYNADFKDKLIVSMPHEFQHLEDGDRKRLRLDNKAVITNSGVLLLNIEELRKNDFNSKIQMFVKDNCKSLVTFDQDILNFVFQEHMSFQDYKKYNLSDKLLEYYNKIGAFRNQGLTLHWVRNNTSILHFLGTPKPWELTYKGELKKFYQEYAEDYWNKVHKIEGEINNVK